jgi:hypothetical protein
MSYQVDSYGNAYFPAGVSVASIPATTGTQARVLVPGVNGRISSATVAQLITQSGSNLVTSVYGRTGAVTAALGDYTTDQVTEGQALYFTTDRARKTFSITTFNTSGPATYDSSTGILNIPQYGSASNGNFVPLTRKISINGQTADLSVDRMFSVEEMVYPPIGIPLSNGTSWGASITNNSANWNTAFGWGNHALAGYLTSFTETDPTVPSHVKAITTTNISNWNTAYSWGNHALAGYLTSFTETDPIWTSEKVNYYTKTQADSRYLQSYTETDPVWTSEKINYYTKTQADGRYLQSFTETDPIWTSEKANYALKTYVDTSISNLIDAAPTALNTLNELAAALGDDANFSTSITTLIGTKEPAITAGTTAQYWRGDKTWQTLPIYTLSGLGGVPTSRTLTINGTSYDLSADRSWTINSMVYPSAGIAVSTGSAWGTSITDNSSNWNSAFTDRFKWDGGATGLVAATGRTSLGLGTAATANTGDFAAASHTHSIANVTGLQTALDGKEPTIAAGTTAQYWRGDKTWQTLPTYDLSPYVPYTGATANVDLGLYGLTSRGLTISKYGSSVNGLIFEQAAGLGLGGAGYTTIGPVGTDGFGFYFSGATKAFYFSATAITTQRFYSLPDASGTIALTSNIPTLSGLGGVPTTRSLTINGVSYDLSADRSWTISTGISGSGTTNYLSKWTGSTSIGNSLVFDNGSAIGINTASPFESSAFKLDVNGGVIIKNTSGVPAQLILIDSNPATGGNNGFVQLVAGGNTATAFGQWQTYYGTSIASGTLRIQPAGGVVLVGSSTAITGAGLLQVAGDVNITGTFRVNGVAISSGTTLNGTGFVKVSGTTISYDNSTYYLASNPSGYITSSSNISGSAGSLSDDSGYIRTRSGGSEASLDSYTDNGIRSVAFSGHSQHLLTWNVGGSTGTVQQLFHYNIPANGWRIRNKTDNSSWSSWGYVVMATGNQGNISGTIYHSGNLTNLNQLSNGPGYITSSATSLSLTGNLTVSSGNATGGGIILADDGDIVDLNDAYLSLRFSYGVRVFSANRGGSAVITLSNTGAITASGNITGANLSGTNTGDQTNISGYSTSVYLGNSSAKLIADGQWAGTGGYPGYSFTGGNSRFGFSSTGGYIDVYTDGNFYAGIDLNGSNNLVWHQGNLTNLNQLSNGPGYITAATNVQGLYLQSLGTGSVNVNNGATAVYRNENGNGGNLSYAPVLHLGGSDTMWQIQGDYYNSSTLRWRAGYAGTWYSWRDIYHSGNLTNLNQLSNGPGYITNTTSTLILTAGDGGAGSQSTVVALRVRGLSAYESLELGIENNYDGVIRSYGNNIRYYSGHWRSVGNVASEDHSHLWYTSKNGSSNWSSPKMILDHNALLTVTGSITTPVGIFTNDGSSRVMYLRGSGNIIQFQDGSSNNKWEVVGRDGTFYVYKNDGSGSGYRWQINASGDHSISGYVTLGSGISTPYSLNATTYNQPGLLLNASGTSSSGAAFGMQQVTGEGWTGIFVDFEPYTGWGLYHDNPNNYFCVTSEGTTGQLRSFTVPSRSSGNRTAYEKIRFDQNNGSILAGGDITAYSDARSKDNIEVIKNAISKIQAIRGVTYTKIDSEGEARNVRHAGVLAQEVLEVLPEVVHQDHNTDMYSVAYGNMAGLFIEAIKEQQLQIEELKKEIKELKNK